MKEKHYVCLGGCKGVSNVLGTCNSLNCLKHAHELTLCECTDGLHNNFKLTKNTKL